MERRGWNDTNKTVRMKLHNRKLRVFVFTFFHFFDWEVGKKPKPKLKPKPKPKSKPKPKPKPNSGKFKPVSERFPNAAWKWYLFIPIVSFMFVSFHSNQCRKTIPQLQ